MKITRETTLMEIANYIEQNAAKLRVVGPKGSSTGVWGVSITSALSWGSGCDADFVDAIAEAVANFEASKAQDVPMSRVH